MTARQHATRQNKVQTQLGRAAVRIFAANERMNQILIERLDPAAWRAKPPGKTRTIAAIFTHMHNVRAKWVRLTAPHLKIPAQLNRASCTPLAHEAHHRGQVCMLTHQLGFPLPNEVTSGLWNWEKLWKECGPPGGPGDDSDTYLVENA